MKLYTWIVALALSAQVFANSGIPADKTHYIAIEAKDKIARSLVSRLGYAIDEIRSDKIYVLGNLKDVERLKKLNLKVSAVPAQEKWFQIPQDRAAKFISLPEVEAELRHLAAKHPNIISLKTLGKTVEGREVKFLRLSSKSEADAELEKLPVVFYMGCHHAREHLSVEVPLRFAQYIADQANKNPDVARLLATRELYIAPIINPDGHAYDYTNGIKGKMWRKNRAQNGGGSVGVDLNRNYGFGWGGQGASTQPNSDTYRGPAPFSEPETQNVKNFIDSQPRMTSLISFHTFSELVLYPWGHTYDKIGQKQGNPDDLPVFEKMANDMAKWNGYTPQQSSDLYIASGDTTDWAYGEHGIFAFTFELSPASMWEGGFYPSPTVIEPTFDANLKPMLYMLEFADNPRRVLNEKIPDFIVTPIKVGIGIASFNDIKL